MSTATTLPAYLATEVRTVANFVKRFDRWMAICDAAKTDPTVYDVSKMPTKAAKHKAYAAAGHINRELGRDRAMTVADLRATAAAGQDALGSLPSPTSKAAGAAWAARARAAGWDVRTAQAGVVVELSRMVTPGDARVYRAAEVEALSLLAEVPRTSPGTTWGSTSDGVGGHAGMTSGYLFFAVSGASKRFASGAQA